MQEGSYRCCAGLGHGARTCQRGYPAALFLLRYFSHSDFPLQASRVRGSALLGESDRSAQQVIYRGAGDRRKGCKRHHILLSRGCRLGDSPTNKAPLPSLTTAGHGSCGREAPSEKNQEAMRVVKLEPVWPLSSEVVLCVKTFSRRI